MFRQEKTPEKSSHAKFKQSMEKSNDRKGSKSPFKASTDKSSELIDDYIDYDEEIPDDSDHENSDSEERIGSSDLTKPPAFSNNALSGGIQMAGSLFGKQKHENLDGNNLLNQFHTNKKESESDVTESDSNIVETGSEKGTDMIDTLIRLYEVDPQGLGDFERELVEKELEKRNKNSPVKTKETKEVKEPPKLNKNLEKEVKQKDNSNLIVQPKKEVKDEKSVSKPNLIYKNKRKTNNFEK